MVNVIDGSVTIFVAVYFRFISKNWLWWEVFGLTLTVFSTICLFLLPESPKYLWSAKKYKEARESLAYIAKINKKTSYTKKFKFETEVEEESIDRKRISISFSSSNN